MLSKILRSKIDLETIAITQAAEIKPFNKIKLLPLTDDNTVCSTLTVRNLNEALARSLLSSIHQVDESKGGNVLSVYHHSVKKQYARRTWSLYIEFYSNQSDSP